MANLTNPTTATSAHPFLTSKKYLAILAGGGDRPFYNLMHSKIFTDDLLAKLNMSSDDIKKRGLRTFTREQTVIIYTHLGLVSST